MSHPEGGAMEERWIALVCLVAAFLAHSVHRFIGSFYIFFISTILRFVNPYPGTIADHVVTRPEYNDFFLISQSG